MYLSEGQTMLMILVIAAGTFLTRSIPFFIFPEGKPIPKYINYLGDVLPYAMIGLLVVYCLKSVSFTTMPFGLPEIIAIGSIIALHLWKGNTLLSIAGGTILYMILVQQIFV